ncbi:MAG: hypothetical protein ACD_35C00054G0002, partial [uncultured bacterium]
MIVSFLQYRGFCEFIIFNQRLGINEKIYDQMPKISGSSHS